MFSSVATVPSAHAAVADSSDVLVLTTGWAAADAQEKKRSRAVLSGDSRVFSAAATASSPTPKMLTTAEK